MSVPCAPVPWRRLPCGMVGANGSVLQGKRMRGMLAHLRGISGASGVSGTVRHEVAKC